MAKNAMRKVSNSVFNVVADTKKMNSINVAILLVSVAIVVVLVILLVKLRKREGFALMSLSEASWVSKGEDGAKGEDGEQGPPGLQGPQGENASSNPQVKEELYSDFEKNFMNEMVNNKLIIKEGNEGEDKYFPVGTINLRNVMTNETKTINYSQSDNSYPMDFKIKYNKLASNSYVKITYTFSMTGNEVQKGTLFQIYVNVNDNNNRELISASSASSGYDVWDTKESLNEIIPRNVMVIGIDTTDEVGIRHYGVKMYAKNPLLSPEAVEKNYTNPRMTFNGITWDILKGNVDDKFNSKIISSCTIEEIVVPDKSKISGDSTKDEDIHFLPGS